MTISKRDLQVLVSLLSSKDNGYHFEMLEDDIFILYNFYGDVIVYTDTESGQELTYYQLPKPYAMPKSILLKLKEFAYEELCDDYIPKGIEDFIKIPMCEASKVGFPYYGLLAHYSHSLELDTWLQQYVVQSVV